MSNTSTNSTVKDSRNKNLNCIKWGIISVYIIGVILWRMNIGASFQSASYIFFISLFAFAMVHGIQRYGFKNMLIWFIVTWIVSNFFETLSIRTGFPFGHYHYTVPGTRIFDVPLLIMFAYFGLAYTSWTVTQAVTGHFNKKITGIYKFVMPVTAAVVMTMHDLCDDPVASTINSQWVWENGGHYFGVPISNFAGWVFVVWAFMQIFTLIISHKTLDVSKNNVSSMKRYWLEALIVYLFLGLGVVLQGFAHTEHVEIYACMAMVSVFTMVFVSFISFLNIINTKELNDSAK